MFEVPPAREWRVAEDAANRAIAELATEPWGGGGAVKGAGRAERGQGCLASGRQTAERSVEFD